MDLKVSTTNIINTVFRRDSISQKQQSQQNIKNLEKSPQTDVFEISIGYVNDTHGQTNNMMRILSGLKGDLKLSAGDNDIGDEKNQEVHKATIKFLNIADIKATAVGNHEMDTTQADLIGTINQYNGKMLAVNVKKDLISNQDPEIVAKLGRASLEYSLYPSMVTEIKGEKIGLIGASPMDMLDRLTHPDYHKDCHIDAIDDTIDDIQREINNLKKQGVNKIILLSHLGHKADKLVAQSVNDLDVIIGGHSHELVEGVHEGKNLFYSPLGEPVVITQAGKDGKYFGELNLSFNKDGVITKVQNNLGDSGLYHKNLVHKAVFDEVLGKPEKIGYIQEAPPAPKTLVEENPHANFVCDIMREKTNSDIGLWHLCGVRNFFHEGEIDSRDIKDISPFLDYVAVANVSEKNLVNLFKETAKTTYSSPGQKPGLFAVSGLEYTINPQNGTLVDLVFIDKDGNKSEIDINNPREDKLYKLVTDEFLMSAGADFRVLAEEKDYIKKYPYDKDVMVCEYIKEKNQPIVINQYGRLKFTPEQ